MWPLLSPVARPTDIYCSSAGQDHRGRMEHGGPEDSNGNESDASQQDKRTSKYEKRRASGHATSGRKREHASRKESRSRMPAAATLPVRPGSEHDKTPGSSSSCSDANHASRQRSRTGLRSILSAIRRNPVSPSCLVKKEIINIRQTASRQLRSRFRQQPEPTVEAGLWSQAQKGGCFKRSLALHSNFADDQR